MQRSHCGLQSYNKTHEEAKCHFVDFLLVTLTAAAFEKAFGFQEPCRPHLCMIRPCYTGRMACIAAHCAR